MAIDTRGDLQWSLRFFLSKKENVEKMERIYYGRKLSLTCGDEEDNENLQKFPVEIWETGSGENLLKLVAKIEVTTPTSIQVVKPFPDMQELRDVLIKLLDEFIEENMGISVIWE